jgi:hypothetical protein
VRNANTTSAFVPNTVHAAADSVRDVFPDDEFWVVQVFAAYEPHPDEDKDPPSPDPEDPTVAYGESIGLNLRQSGPAAIYLETIRDREPNPIIPRALATMPSEEQLPRVVAHEVFHRLSGLRHNQKYGYRPRLPGGDLDRDAGDVGLLDQGLTNNDFSKMQEYILTPAQLHLVRGQSAPEKEPKTLK